MARCFLCRRQRFRTLYRPTDDGERAPAIDDRLDTDRPIDALLIRCRILAGIAQVLEDGQILQTVDAFHHTTPCNETWDNWSIQPPVRSVTFCLDWACLARMIVAMIGLPY